MGVKREITGDLRQVLKPYLGHWDVPENSDLVLTIDKIYEEDVKNEHGTERKPVMYWQEANYKPMIVNKTNNDSITALYGKRTASNTWQGKKIALYAANVPRSSDGKGLRIREYAPEPEEYICEECGAIIKDTGKFKAKNIAISSKNQFGRVLCISCGKAEKEALEKEFEDAE